jgi:hypothetical protein
MWRDMAIEQAIDEDIKSAFRDSEFKRRSMEGVSNNLRAQ